MNIKDEYQKALQKIAAKSKTPMSDILNETEAPEVHEEAPKTTMSDILQQHEKGSESETTMSDILQQQEQQQEQPEKEPDISVPELNTFETITGQHDAARSVNTLEEISVLQKLQEDVEEMFGDPFRKVNKTKEKNLNTYEENGTIEDVLSGLTDALGPSTPDEDEVINYVNNEKGKVWAFMSKDEATTKTLEELIGIYYLLKIRGGFVGNNYTLDLNPDDVETEEYNAVRKLMPKIFSPSGFFSTLSNTQSVEEIKDNKKIEISARKKFAEFIYSITENPDPKHHSPDEFKKLRSKKQYLAQELGGFIQKKIGEILIKLQAQIDKKLAEDDPEFSEEHNMYLTPYFEFTEEDTENTEGIQLARLSTKNEGNSYIKTLLQTSAGYTTSIVMRAIFEREKYWKYISDKIQEEKEKAVEQKQVRESIAETPMKDTGELIKDVMLSQQQEFPPDSRVAQFITTLYGNNSNPTKLSRQERFTGVNYPTTEGNVQFITKPNSRKVILISNILDKDNKNKFMSKEPPFDVIYDHIIDKIKKITFQDEGEELNEKSKQILNNLFTYAKVFLINDDGSVEEDLSDTAQGKIKRHKLIPKLQGEDDLLLMFGNYADAAFGDFEDEDEDENEDEEVSTTEKTKAPPKSSKKVSEITKQNLSIEVKNIFKNNENKDSLNEELLTFLNKIIEKIETSKNKTEAAINVGPLNTAVKRINSGKRVTLEKILEYIAFLDIPE